MKDNDYKLKYNLESSDSRYPRKGHPIAPSILSDVLCTRIPKEIIGEIVMNYSDLNESTWLTFKRETCQKLGKLVIKEIQKALSNKRSNILNRRIPKFPSGVTINDLPLEVRTVNCFAQKYGMELVNNKVPGYTIGNLMKIRNFGVKSLVDFLCSLEYSILLNGGFIENVEQYEKDNIDPELLSIFSQNVNKLMKLSFLDIILYSDFRFGIYIKTFNKNLNSLKELADFLSRKMFKNTEEVEYSIKVIDELLFRLNEVSNLSLEKELRDIVQSVASERDTEIYLKRYGWDGNKKYTLNEIGILFGITRERARQICEKIDLKFETNHLPTFAPTLSKVISVISKYIPCVGSDLLLRIEKLKIIENTTFEVSGLCHAISTLSKIHFITESIENSEEEIIVTKSLEGQTKALISFTKKASRHWGALSIDELIAQFEEKKGFNFIKESALSILQSHQDFRWLDRPNEWFWFETSVATRITSRIKKILSVADSISAPDLRTCIRRDYNMEGFSPPKYVLIELCRQLPEYTVENEIITLDQPLKWEEVLDENEMLMVLILKEKGPVLRREELENYCLDLGMNRNTLNRYLSHSPIIFRYGYMVYGIPNADVDSATIESLIPERNVSEVLEDYGWKDGKVWLGYKTSNSMIRDGLFTVPASMKIFIDGKFELKSSDNKTIGNLTVQHSGAWGLVPLFHRRGGEPGDFLILEFDLSSRVAVATLGDEGLIENLY